MRPEDDYTHPAGPEVNFNESMYFHVYDPAAGVGGFVRLANRPNEGRGERTVCLYLPGGRLGFSYARPGVSNNDVMDAGGLRFTVREPMRHLDVAFDGQLSVLGDPARMVDPKQALTESPQVACSLRLAVRGLAEPFDHSFDTEEGSFAPNHYEQLLSAEGTLRVGESHYSVSGHGLRDHSWGPRYWQTPWFYRWVHGSSEGFGFMGAYFGRPDGSDVRGGFVWDGTDVHELDGLDITSERDELGEQTVIEAVLRAGGEEWVVRGEVLAKVPLRNRRVQEDGVLAVTRIVEGLTRWTLADGREVHGMSEYLDQILDGKPVGLAV